MLAQIDWTMYAGKTLAAATTVGTKSDWHDDWKSAAIGTEIAKSKENKISAVAFDRRSCWPFSWLADAARQEGLF